MKTTPDASRRMMAALAALALAGCAASPGGQPHGGQHAGPSTAATAAPASGPFYGLETTTGGSAAGSATRHSDEGTKCAMHERHMQNMSPEERRKHMEMMRRHCP